MDGISFAVRSGDRRIELEAILELLGERASTSSWRFRDLEVAPSDVAERLHDLADRGEAISGEELSELARQKPQLIDGEVEGSDLGVVEPWVVIRAVDSTSWDLLCSDDKILRAAQARFPGATPLPR